MARTADSGAPEPLREQIREAGRLAWLAARLAWGADPRLALGILLLIAVEALLAPFQLALSKAVLDRAAFDLGAAAAAPPLVGRLPLATWIALAAAALAAGQLIQPVASTLQALAGDRLAGHVGEQLIAAANRWRGLARFEDPRLADDLERARTHAARSGLSVMIYAADAAVELLTAAALALALLVLHPLVPVLLVLASLPQMLRHWQYGQVTGSALYFQTPEARRLEYSRDVSLVAEPAPPSPSHHPGRAARRPPPSGRASSSAASASATPRATATCSRT